MKWTEGSDRLISDYYPTAKSIAPPSGSGAALAIAATIQPFPSRTAAEVVLPTLAKDQTVDVALNGGLSVQAHSSLVASPLPVFDFSVAFEILMLVYPDRRQPRVYSLSPEISEATFPHHPHLRVDLPLMLHRPIAALCLYLASTTSISRDMSGLAAVLDYTSLFLAKHLYWVSTQRMVCRKTGSTIYAPNFARHSSALFVGSSQQPNWATTQAAAISCASWTGAWIGAAASHSWTALSRIPPDSECFCGSGKLFGGCCLAKALVGADEEARAALVA